MTEQEGISYDDLDVRAGRVKEIKDHPNADKLYLMTVEIGNEERSVIAGLRPFFSKEELEGKNIVVLCNLKPSKLRGHMSYGMVMAAEAGKKLMLLNPGEGCKGKQVDFLERTREPRKEVSITQFSQVPFEVKDKMVSSNGKTLLCNEKPITVDIEDGAMVR